MSVSKSKLRIRAWVQKYVTSFLLRCSIIFWLFVILSVLLCPVLLLMIQHRIRNLKKMIYNSSEVQFLDWMTKSILVTESHILRKSHQQKLCHQHTDPKQTFTDRFRDIRYKYPCHVRFKQSRFPLLNYVSLETNFVFDLYKLQK